MSKSHLIESEKFARNKKLSLAAQFEKNLDDFHRLVKVDADSYELECITAEKAMSKIQDTLTHYAKAQDILLEEASRGDEE